MLKTIQYLLLIVALVVSVLAAIALTELGQLINMPRDFVLSIFNNRTALAGLAIVTLCTALAINVKLGLWSLGRSVFASATVVGMLLAAFFIMPYFFFLPQQHTANYLPISETGDYLDDDADVLVLEHDGSATAFPVERIWQPHIAGLEANGKPVAMTYCVLTNSGIAYSPVLNGQEMDLKVLMQTHNNLVFFDSNSGKTVQQIRSEIDGTGEPLEQIPSQRMNWSAFKQAYPNGQVFFEEFDSLREKTVELIFGVPLDGYSDLDRNEPMFPTLSLKDNRLPNKTKVWGVEINGDALAVTREHFQTNNRVVTELGGQNIVLAYFPKYGSVGGFALPENANGEGLETLDLYGSTSLGKLERIDLLSEVYWMVWSHFHPDSKLLHNPG